MCGGGGGGQRVSKREDRIGFGSGVGEVGWGAESAQRDSKKTAAAHTAIAAQMHLVFRHPDFSTPGTLKKIGLLDFPNWGQGWGAPKGITQQKIKPN